MRRLGFLFVLGFPCRPKPWRRLVGFLGFFIFLPASALAAPLTFHHHHHVLTLTPDRTWSSEEELWEWKGKEVIPPARLRVEGDDHVLPEGWSQSSRVAWDRDIIREAIRRKIAPSLERAAGKVAIHRTASGVVFEGVGFPGRSLDLEAAVSLTIFALEEDIFDVFLPVREMQPEIVVNDEELQKAGIRELVAFGESDFTGSPVNRKHNIALGLERFNGHLIGQGETFSFNEVLGPVNAETGYRKELTILGDRTLPDYGGGICQVSTTAYRGIWEYGFPIVSRRNHSYAVRYYAPLGTDATIYPPSTDLLFENDSPGALLVQTHQENDRAYFLYYGTRDKRSTQVIGPYTWNRQEPPPPRTEETTDIAPGTKRKLGEAIPGMQAAWFRVVRKDGEEMTEGFFSSYQARPLFHQIGVEHLSDHSTAPPDWIDLSPSS